MAKRATATAEGGARKKSSGKTKASGAKRVQNRSSSGSSGGTKADPIDALIKLLQSPLVIDLLAVGATAALAAITEQRSGAAQRAAGTSGKVMKAAGKAAAAAIGRRIATEFEEIKSASKKPQSSGDTR